MDRKRARRQQRGADGVLVLLDGWRTDDAGLRHRQARARHHRGPGTGHPDLRQEHHADREESRPRLADAGALTELMAYEFVNGVVDKPLQMRSVPLGEFQHLTAIDLASLSASPARRDREMFANRRKSERVVCNRVAKIQFGTGA